MVERLGGCVVAWLGGWVVGWLSGWAVGWLGGSVAEWLRGWVVLEAEVCSFCQHQQTFTTNSDQNPFNNIIYWCFPLPNFKIKIGGRFCRWFPF